VRPIHRKYVDVSFGQVHLAECAHPGASGLPVVLLHQTPRSWDEYREILPLLGATRRTIAVDTPGMGASDPVPGTQSIEGYSVGIIEALDALDLERFHLVGHHTGGLIAVEIATTIPERVDRLILSSTPMIDESARAARRNRSPIDAVSIDADGHHLAELWQRRQAFYPEDRPDLLHRFVRDAMAVDDPEAGHDAVGAYRMEQRIDLLTRRPLLLVGHEADPYAFPDLEPLASSLPQAQVATIPAGMVPLEHAAAAFAEVVRRFLDEAPVELMPARARLDLRSFEVRLACESADIDRAAESHLRDAGIELESWGAGRAAIRTTVEATTDVDAIVAARERLLDAGGPQQISFISVSGARVAPRDPSASIDPPPSR